MCSGVFGLLSERSRRLVPTVSTQSHQDKKLVFRVCVCCVCLMRVNVFAHAHACSIVSLSCTPLQTNRADDGKNAPPALPTAARFGGQKTNETINVETMMKKLQMKVPVAGGDDRVLECGRGGVHPHGGKASARVGRPRHLGGHHGHVRGALSGGGLESHGPQAGALLGSAADQARLRLGPLTEAGRAPQLSACLHTRRRLGLIVCWRSGD